MLQFIEKDNKSTDAALYLQVMFPSPIHTAISYRFARQKHKLSENQYTQLTAAGPRHTIWVNRSSKYCQLRLKPAAHLVQSSQAWCPVQQAVVVLLALGVLTDLWATALNKSLYEAASCASNTIMSI